MLGFINRFFWRIITFSILLLIIYIIWQYTLEVWTFDQVLIFITDVAVYGLPVLLLIIIIYKTFIERIILWFNRKKSAQIIVDKLAKINQVSGAVRSGKDSSTIGAALIARDYILNRERKELLKLEHDLYIYDFELLKDWLNKNGKKFFVASEYRINLVFTQMIKENECFIAEYWKKKFIPKKHFQSWKYRKNKYTPDVAFQDGLTPGGQHFLDILKRYTVLYMYHNFIPNFIMSNQPILESFEVIKKSGKIKRLFSKKLSQDYFKLKLNTPIPFPKRGFIIETETAIFYSNTDSTEGKYFKDESGIREFYTTAGHLLREEVFLYGITQSATRTLKALRELYPGYQHVFKMKFRSISSFSRSLLKFRSQLKKLRILQLRLERWFYRHSKKLAIIDRRITRKIYRLKYKISRLSQKDAIKWSKGYIIFYKGIYEDIKDVGKRVTFPKFGVILENKTEITTYNTFGFKQTNKISDCFGRYDTHFMYTIREAKEILQNMHFNDVDNWKQFKVIFDDIKGMNYATFNALMTIVITAVKKEETKLKKREKIEKQNRSSMTPPIFSELENIELSRLATDFGIDFKSLSYTFRFSKQRLIKKLLVHKLKRSKLEKLNFNNLRSLATVCKIDFMNKETIIEKWQEHITKKLIIEFKLFKLKDKYNKST